MPDAAPVHAGLIAAWRRGRWRGVMLCGPSGAGKSALALRAMASGWALVADDRVRLWRSGDGVYGCAPATLEGLVEARGQGVVRRPALRMAQIVLVLEPGRDERLPTRRTTAMAGVALPLARLDYVEAGAVVRLDFALDAALRPAALL